MTPFEVRFKPSVEKDLRGLPGDARQRVLDRIGALRDEPLPRGSLKIEGAERLHRVRVGEYRVVYEVDAGARVVTIHYVRHRKEAYRRR